MSDIDIIFYAVWLIGWIAITIACWKEGPILGFAVGLYWPFLALITLPFWWNTARKRVIKLAGL